MRFLIVIALVFFTLNVHAQTTDSMEELKGVLDKIHTLSGRFEQVIKDNKGQPVQEPSQGKFSLKRPGYFLWESEEPFNQLVIGTPESLKIYDPDLEQLTSYPRGTSDQNNPAHLLSGDLSTLRSTFTVKKANSSKKDVAVFELTPTKADTSFKKIRFYFDKDKLSQLSFLDKLDQTTDIAFKKLEMNAPIKEEAFNFIAPEGTDIIANE